MEMALNKSPVFQPERQIPKIKIMRLLGMALLVCVLFLTFFYASSDLQDLYSLLLEEEHDTMDKSIPTYQKLPMDNSRLEEQMRTILTDEGATVTVSETRSCRKTLPHLWTQRAAGNSNQNSSFPSCAPLIRAILNGTKSEHRSLSSALMNWTVPEPHNTSSIMQMMDDCGEFRRSADFAEKPASKEEEDYPLAYVFLPYKNMPQAVRFFRMIYQPQNAYCITYDTTADEEVKKAITKLASCLPSNVMINPNLEPIYYSTFTLLHSVMECINVLRKSPIKWRYVQIVSWNDFPLKTNWEMVKIFKALNGSQDCELGTNDRPFYITNQHYNHDKVFSRKNGLRPVPPGGLTFYKGSFATSMSKEFVEFMFTDPLSIRLYNYFNGSQFPDEFYWSSLIHNVQMNAPGRFPGQCSVFYDIDNKRKPYVSRFQVWSWFKGDLKCRGKIERVAFCVYGIGDFAMLIKRMELFGHKFYEEFQPAVLYCLEEWYWEKVCLGTHLNFSYYENLPSVRYHNLPNSEKDNFVCTV